MSTLILMRHAQASFGAANYDKLSGLGEKQARASQPYFAARLASFSKILAGPRARHRDTARLATEGLALPPVETVPEFDEFTDANCLLRAAETRIGKSLAPDSGISGAELLRHYSDQVMLWATGETETEGVVSVHAWRQRVAALMDRHMNPERPDEIVLAVTSGGVIGMAFAIATGMSNQRMGRMIGNFRVDNCGLTGFYNAPYGSEVLFFNQSAHLPLELVSPN